MNTPLINKVLDRHNLHESFRILAEQLNTSELSTFLMHVFATRVAQTSPSDLRNAMSVDRFVKPSTVSPLTFHQFDTIAFQTLPEFYELIELSPLAPLGTVSVLATVDPGAIVNTIRSHDVVSDCTNVLAVHAAAQRHELHGNERPEMDFCASQRLVRAQNPKMANHTAHFKILTLVSSGRDTGSYGFEQRKLFEHMSFYVELIRNFEAAEDIQIDIVLKEYADTGMEWNKFTATFESEHTSVTHQRYTRENWNYYSPFQFNINLRVDDQVFNLADGGIVDWTQKLLSDKKERLLISGFGTELFCKLFLSQE